METEAKKIKCYFKGGSGIQSPVDVNGMPINEGDILTHCWFDGSDHEWINRTEEEKQNLFHKPSVIVKRHEKGYLYGEDLDTRTNLYMHDFRFKYTKNLSANK